MATSGKLTQLGPAMAGIMFVWAICQKYFPHNIHRLFENYAHKLIGLVYPYIRVTFNEYGQYRFKRSEAYSAIETYLSENSSSGAKRFKADLVKDSQSVVLSMDDHEEVTDEFRGVKVWWKSNKLVPRSQSISIYPGSDEKRFYRLSFHRKDRKIITTDYLDFVLKEGKSIALKNRQRKLYTNCKNSNRWDENKSMWSHVLFEHPASFETLGMEPSKKKDIINDLVKFSKSKDYYQKIGKAWKRGYLLHGPPGTGKSTMIAAMANLLEYDIYDLELTSVKDNTELRKLLIETSSKSIMVIEDIDCSLDLTGQRKKKVKKDEEDNAEVKNTVKKVMKEVKSNVNDSEVTLSGLLNFVDGLWSSCGGERIIVFTTNYVDKLDPALIRRGRMDKHIELSYCCFEAFKVLARNYWDVEEHGEFGAIERMLGETEITPADVAESLMPKSDDDDVDTCLSRLVLAIEMAKKEAKLKADTEEKKKIEEEEKKIEEEKKKIEEEKKKIEEEKKKDEEEAKKKIEDEKAKAEKAEKKKAEEEKEKSEAKENGIVKENGA